MYDEFNVFERILFEDVLEVGATCGWGWGWGGGVDRGVSGGVSSFTGVGCSLLFLDLVAVIRVDLLGTGLETPEASVRDFLDPPVGFRRVAAAIPDYTEPRGTERLPGGKERLWRNLGRKPEKWMIKSLKKPQ